MEHEEVVFDNTIDYEGEDEYYEEEGYEHPMEEDKLEVELLRQQVVSQQQAMKAQAGNIAALKEMVQTMKAAMEALEMGGLTGPTRGINSQVSLPCQQVSPVLEESPYNHIVSSVGMYWILWIVQPLSQIGVMGEALDHNSG